MSDDEKVRHDFKNQLAIIRGFAEIMLAEATQSGARRHDLEEIHRAAVSALGLLDRMYPEPPTQDRHFASRPSGTRDT